jgi:hypothetical protein
LDSDWREVRMNGHGVANALDLDVSIALGDGSVSFSF